MNLFEINFGLALSIIGCIILTIFIVNDANIWYSIIKLSKDRLWLVNVFIILVFYLTLTLTKFNKHKSVYSKN